MDRGWYARFSTVLTATLLAWLALWPSLDSWIGVPTVVSDIFDGRISPGLDIRGGMRLMYEVDVEKYIETQRDRDAARVLRLLGGELGVLEEDEIGSPPEEKIQELRERVTVEKVGGKVIRVTFQNADDASKLTRAFMRENFPNLSRQESGENQFRLVIGEERVADMRTKAVQQAVRTINNRINALGIAETTVIPREDDGDIIVEIPGAEEEDFDRIRDIISRTAQLEFRVVDDMSRFVAGLTDLPEGIERSSETVSAGTANPTVSSGYLFARGDDAMQRLQAYIATLELPEDRVLLLGRMERSEDPDSDEAADPDAEAPSYRTYTLLSTSDVTGRHIDDAFVTFDQTEGGRPVVSLRFKREGAELFRRLTANSIKKRMAIVLDDNVESAPVIQAEIGGGNAQITLGRYGDYNSIMQEANDLVLVLKAGALDAPLTPANEQLIGPTLGEDSVAQGAKGALIGVLFVLLFMAMYYQVAGLVADTMVLLNLLFLLSLMAFLGATLTLPGVAAIALTVGMAVDANVLITERIREELRLGKSPRSAVDQGFARAFWSVFDSQLTTFIAGVVLFQYGSGPIKGFAVMLMLGIFTSLFTGIFCSKVMFDWIVRGLKVQRLRVG